MFLAQREILSLSANNYSTQVSNIHINMGQISNTRHNKSQEHTQKVTARVGNIKIIIKQRDLDIRTTDFAFTDPLS